jgi:predicted outer membrane repeat protein
MCRPSAWVSIAGPRPVPYGIRIRLASLGASYRRIVMYWCGALGFFLTILIAGRSEGREILVADPTDAALGEAVTACRNEVSRHCTLRAAVTVANEEEGPDTIKLRVETAKLERQGVDDGNASGDLDVAGDLTIVGEFPGTTIDGVDKVRLIEVLSGSLTLEKLALRNGLAEALAGSPCSAQGGAVCARAGTALHLKGVTVESSLATHGGALAVHGDAVLEASTVKDNQATSSSGGIAFEGGTLTILASTVQGNTAMGSVGGGISAGPAELVRIERSAIVGNKATVDGGGIAMTSGRLEAENVTVSGNEAVVGRGGGIGLEDTASAALNNVTVVRNKAAGGGGGIYAAATADVAIFNSLLIGSTPDDCAGTFLGGAPNLVQLGQGCTMKGVVATVGEAQIGDLTGAPPGHPLVDDPKIKPDDEKAIGRGDPASCTKQDQRGGSRFDPQHGDGACDLGAIEFLADGDGDGVPDRDDSCPNVKNSGKDDDPLDPLDPTKKGDGIDDACDPDPNRPARDGWNGDDDDDGALNWEDQCADTPAIEGIVECSGIERIADAKGCSPGQTCDCTFRVKPSATDTDGVPWKSFKNWRKCVTKGVRGAMKAGLSRVCAKAVRRTMIATGRDQKCGKPRHQKGDPDGDGICMTCTPPQKDNCPHAYNPSQRDEPDGDGIGNACDPDDDDDGRPDRIDNCPLHSNRSQWDADCDGLGNPCDPDDDNDGIPDDIDETPIDKHPAPCR